MEAKDTVMENLAQAIIARPDLPMGQAIAIEQAKISFKAGIQEVVKEVTKVSQQIDENGEGTEDGTKVVETIYYIGKGRLEAKLKEWGIE